MVDVPCVNLGLYSGLRMIGSAFSGFRRRLRNSRIHSFILPRHFRAQRCCVESMTKPATRRGTPGKNGSISPATPSIKRIQPAVVRHREKDGCVLHSRTSSVITYSFHKRFEGAGLHRSPAGEHWLSSVRRFISLPWRSHRPHVDRLFRSRSARPPWYKGCPLACTFHSPPGQSRGSDS